MKPGDVHDLGELAGVKPLGIMAGDDVTALFDAVDVVIDFTVPAASVDHAKLAAKTGKGLVIGTTGLDAEQTRAVESAAQHAAILWAPNMSLGVNLLLGLVEQVARSLGDDWDIEIVEMHHRHKIDAPSGTALGLGRAAAKGRGVVLDDVAKHKVTAIVVVPVMLSRMLDVLETLDPKPDLSSLRIMFVSGSQLGAELASRTMKDIGPVVYNLYGSTEIAFVSIARPQDLKKNPATVGPLVKGVKVKILDEHGRELPRGEVGRIFVGNFFPFEGYTGGGGKEIIDGLMSSGDVGRLDSDGLLYVSGRDDEMIVSGGENVFPAEVEDLISGHPDVVEATAIGVEDEDFGARLRAFVVAKDGSELSEETIKNYVRDHLARYKVPREVVFLAELPRNPTGKILKRELRQIAVT